MNLNLKPDWTKVQSPHTSSARNIGVTFDSHINLEKHVVMKTSKQTSFTYRILQKYGTVYLKTKLRYLFMLLFLLSFFFCNALLYGLQRSVLDRLQYVQNCAARLVSRTRSSEHITTELRQLHWLPIKQLIAYKILLLTYKATNGMDPKYMVDPLERFTPKSQLRSSSNNINLLVIQKSNLKSFGDRSFRVAAPRLWNLLPNSTRLIQYLNVFKNK